MTKPYDMNKKDSKQIHTTERPTSLDKLIGGNLKKIREANHISVESFCVIADLTKDQLIRYEKGEDPVPATDLYTYAVVLGVTVDVFFF